MKIAYFFRKPTATFFSIEMLFGTIISNLNIGTATKINLPFKSAFNPFLLLRNCLYASKKQGQVNHITGDVNYLALFLSKRKTILTLHDIDSLQIQNKLKSILLQFIWLKLPVNCVRYITVVSNYTKSQLLKAYHSPEDKIVVIPNCIPFTEKDFKPKTTIDKASPVLLQIGTKKNKNLENLVSAIKGVPCKLIVIGVLSPEQDVLLKDHHIDYKNYSSITYNKVIELYYEADIVTFVSIYEGFGLPIIEANALGRPVITSNCTAMPETAGKGALLVDPLNPEQIREGIIKLVTDNLFRNDLVEAGYKNSLRFRPNVVVPQYEALYRKVLEENE
jgi:glycosyltransferase involved in cell wall biosynthesis